MTPPNKGKPWTYQSIAAAHQMARDGVPYTAIAEHFGRTVGAIRQRVAKVATRQFQCPHTRSSPSKRAEAYRLYVGGRSWDAVACLLSYADRRTVAAAAKQHCVEQGLPWPIPRKARKGWR